MGTDLDFLGRNPGLFFLFHAFSLFFHNFRSLELSAKCDNIVGPFAGFCLRRNGLDLVPGVKLFPDFEEVVIAERQR